jgi:hypothetical protein
LRTYGQGDNFGCATVTRGGTTLSQGVKGMATPVNPRPRAALTRHPRSPHTISQRELHALWMLQHEIIQHKREREITTRKRARHQHEQTIAVFERASKNWLKIMRERIEDGAILSKDRWIWNPTTGQVIDTRARGAQRAHSD